MTDLKKGDLVQFVKRIGLAAHGPWQGLLPGDLGMVVGDGLGGDSHAKVKWFKTGYTFSMWYREIEKASKSEVC